MTAPGEPLPATYGEHLMSVDTGFTHQAEPRRTKEKVTGFYVRGLNGTKALDVVEKQKYIAQRRPGTPDDA